MTHPKTLVDVINNITWLSVFVYLYTLIIEQGQLERLMHQICIYNQVFYKDRQTDRQTDGALNTDVHSSSQRSDWAFKWSSTGMQSEEKDEAWGRLKMWSKNTKKFDSECNLLLLLTTQCHVERRFSSVESMLRITGWQFELQPEILPRDDTQGCCSEFMLSRNSFDKTCKFAKVCLIWIWVTDSGFSLHTVETECIVTAVLNNLSQYKIWKWTSSS